MFAYMSASPFVLQSIVGLSPAGYSIIFAACSLAVAVGSAIAGRTAEASHRLERCWVGSTHW